MGVGVKVDDVGNPVDVDVGVGVGVVGNPVDVGVGVGVVGNPVDVGVGVGVVGNPVEVDDGAGVVLVTPSVPIIVIVPDESIKVVAPLFFTVVEVGVEVTSTPLAVVVVVVPSFIMVDEIT